jgi:hypothetical protein
MTLPLMPKATAVWLVENTALTFDQIAEFCGMHPLEVQGVADGEVAAGIVGHDPIVAGQLTREELERCQADPSARLRLREQDLGIPAPKRRRGRYTPVSKRGDRPDAIAWVLKFHPEISDAQLQKLLGTTKQTINAVRDRTHWNMANIKPQDPISLGICSQAEFDAAVQKAQARRPKERVDIEKIREEARDEQTQEEGFQEASTPSEPSGNGPSGREKAIEDFESLFSGGGDKS